MALVGFGVRTNRSNMQMLMLPGRFSEKNEYDASYWIPNKNGIAKLMAQHFGLESTIEQQETEPSSLRVAIQDSTGGDRSNLRPLLRALEKAGYRNVFISKPWSEPLDVTHIIAQQGDGDKRRINSQYFGIWRSAGRKHW